MNNTNKKLNRDIVIIVLLILALITSSVVLALSVADIPNNIINTGIVDIEIGGYENNNTDGDVFYYSYNNRQLRKLINDEDRFEPGYTARKVFFVENIDKHEDSEGVSDDIYVKVYFKNVSGLLENQLVITLNDLSSGECVFKGVASDFVRNNDSISVVRIKKAEKHNMELLIHYPEACGNEGQGKNLLSFDFCAEAVQTRHNDEQLFPIEEG